MDTDHEPTYAPSDNAYKPPTREAHPDLFVALDWLHSQESVQATDNPHALCFNCKGQARVMTACLYEGAKDHVCIWRDK